MLTGTQPPAPPRGQGEEGFNIENIAKIDSEHRKMIKIRSDSEDHKNRGAHCGASSSFLRRERAAVSSWPCFRTAPSHEL